MGRGRRQTNTVGVFINAMTVNDTKTTNGVRWNCKEIEDIINWDCMKIKPTKSKSQVMMDGKIIEQGYNIQD